MIDPVKMDFLERWAAANKCYVETKGEVGFMRPCVGIIHGSSYVDLPLYGSQYYYEEWNLLPTSPKDAYHKHDCLCVLVHGEDEAAYDAALEQLYTWVKDLNDKQFVVRTQDRETYNKDGFGKVLELMMGGTSQAVLALEKNVVRA